MRTNFFFKDISGQRFNKLIAIEPTEKRNGSGCIVWKCQCDCGNSRLVPSKYLLDGSVKSCGCHRFIDVTGQRFGRLVVIEFIEKRSRFPFWLCRCDCGNDAIVNVYALLNGRTVSCGCRRKSITLLPEGEASFNCVYKSYKQNADARDILFELTREEFKNLTSQNCYYCGLETRQYSKWRSDHQNGAYVHNGIDRVDSSRGYIFDNCVPCCRVCNVAKRDMPVDDFYAWIERVYKFSHSKNRVAESIQIYSVTNKTEIGTMETFMNKSNYLNAEKSNISISR